jgi:EAL domain-containing protein (putative c-di-GMP-specific phosphodiesterase class I)/GGDEF domain-containing protein
VPASFFSPSAELSRHRSQPRPGRPASAARSERDEFLTVVQHALDRTRLTRRPSHALIALDLEGCTRIRNSAGAHAERRLLAMIRQRIAGSLGADDHMASMGSDEWQVLVACDGDASIAWRVAELMMNLVTAPYALDERRVSVTACFGIAMVQPHHLTVSAVVADALAAVHRARNVGASRCVMFDGAQYDASLEQLELGAELRAAVERGEFRMHSQPIVSCRTGALASLEALLRWEHPVRGTLAPAAFLETLLRIDLMAQVGRWIVGEVARQAVEWRDAIGLGVPIAINLSPRQLTEPLFLPHALASIAAMGGSPENVLFEMTEEIELGSGEIAIRALRELRAQGYRVCIDDFGTGYSSLSYLQRLPVDALKIDRSFVEGVDVDPRQRTVVGAVVELAHVLDLDLIAEGVERQEQIDVLRAMGCDFIQGHHVSPPLPADGMKAWLAGRR